MVGNIYAIILVERVSKGIEGLIDDEQLGFVSNLRTKTSWWKLREKKRRVYVGFMDMEKKYDKFKREALWQVLRIYDVGSKLLNVF